jgi:hypothetical protein
LESFARWVSSREYRAGLAAAGLSLVPLLSFLSGGVLVLMRLQKGALAGWRSGALAAGVLLVFGLAAGGQLFVAASALAVWVPALALTGQLAGSGSFSRVALAALTGAAGVAIVTHWVVRDPVELWGPVIGELMAAIGPADGTVSEELVVVLAQAMPGIAAASLFLAVMIALMLGMWWHAGLTSPGAFGNAFRNLRLGKVPVIMTGLVYLLAQAAGWPVGRSLVLVLFSGLALQGLAVVHGVAAARGWPGMVLGVVYLCVVIAAPYALMALAMLAVADAWMDFRARARAAQP